jgi:hypothetical protein
MASWWREDKKFTNRITGWCGTVNLREPCIYLMALICQLYGKKYCSKILEAWMPLEYTVAIIGCNFNWGEIISKKLSTYVQQAQISKEWEAPTFYMASYLLYVMCARNIFANMNLIWHVVDLPVHVYFSVLWENKYKKSYSLICDESITQIYLILFKKEFQILSTIAKKIISKVGHWYLDEHATYIRVFRATGAPHILPSHVPD